MDVSLIRSPSRRWTKVYWLFSWTTEVWQCYCCQYWVLLPLRKPTVLEMRMIETRKRLFLHCEDILSYPYLCHDLIGLVVGSFSFLSIDLFVYLFIFIFSIIIFFIFFKISLCGPCATFRIDSMFFTWEGQVSPWFYNSHTTSHIKGSWCLPEAILVNGISPRPVARLNDEK